MQSAAPGRVGFEISPLAQPQCAGLLPSLSFHGRWDESPHCLGVQCLRLCCSTAEGTGSVPGQGGSMCCVVMAKNPNQNKKPPPGFF